jgi:VIT1/CCC1 family predicted Fe2+/Mn2+ transporter
MADTTPSVPHDTMSSGFGLPEALDLIEGVAVGGVVGVAAYIVGGAVASLPAAFITTPVATALSVVAGGLAFVGVAISKIRRRRGLD